jgi:hypothetical protein
MNTAQGPDLLGVCEVENRFVIDRLVERVNTKLPAPRSYAVVHADTDDLRGIDVAFIYDDTLFRVPLPLEESVFFHVVMRRYATREIVAVFGNHWPSRSGGQFESEDTAPLPVRPLAISTCGCSSYTDRKHRCSRWGTSTTSRSTLPLFDTHSAPGSVPRSPLRERTHFCGI